MIQQNLLVCHKNYEMPEMNRQNFVLLLMNDTNYLAILSVTF